MQMRALRSWGTASRHASLALAYMSDPAVLAAGSVADEGSPATKAVSFNEELLQTLHNTLPAPSVGLHGTGGVVEGQHDAQAPEGCLWTLRSRALHSSKVKVQV